MNYENFSFHEFLALVPKSQWTLSQCEFNIGCHKSLNEAKSILPQGSKIMRGGTFVMDVTIRGVDYSDYIAYPINIWMSDIDKVNFVEA